MDLSIPAITPDTATPWSDLQLAIFTALETSPDNLLIEAVAGSGKTTTLVEGVTRVLIQRPIADILVVAFNKSIQQTFERKLPPGPTAKTFHALGFALIRQRLPQKPEVRGSRTYAILKDILAGRPDFYEDHKRDMVSLVSLAKAHGLRPEEADLDFFRALLDNYSLSVPAEAEELACACAAEALIRSAADPVETIDFDDMLWLPVIRDWKWPTFSHVFVDEAQDLNPIQHTIISKVLRPSSRIIAFGDRRQAIYGFRGADASSMDTFVEAHSAVELPLSISYRCPKAVVAEAQQIVPQIEAGPSAPAGLVQSLDLLPLDAPPTSLVLCRNNRPLFSLGMEFLRAGTPCHVRGKFEGTIAAFIKGFNTNDLEALDLRMRRWLSDETDRLEDRGAYGKADELRDRYGCVQALCAGASTVKDALRNLSDLTREGRGITLSSIHKAKGLEAPDIFLYLPQLIPATYARSPAQLLQEENLRYVAITRAQTTLTYIEQEHTA